MACLRRPRHGLGDPSAVDALVAPQTLGANRPPGSAGAQRADPQRAWARGASRAPAVIPSAEPASPPLAWPFRCRQLMRGPGTRRDGAVVGQPSSHADRVASGVRPACMSRRFIPPAVAIFAGGTDAAFAAAVARAREEGFMEGRLHGLQEGHAAGRLEGETRVRETLQAELDALRTNYAKLDQQNLVSAALDRVLAARAADLAALDLAARTAITAGLRTVFPVLLACSAGMEVEALLQAALTERPDETLRLRAHPDTLAAVTGDARGALPDAARVTLVADPSLATGAAEIAWTGGGLTFDPASLLEHVAAMLGAVPPSPAAAPIPPSSPEPAEEPPT